LKKYKKEEIEKVFRLYAALCLSKQPHNGEVSSKYFSNGYQKIKFYQQNSIFLFFLVSFCVSCKLPDPHPAPVMLSAAFASPPVRGLRPLTGGD
jgi:hypothetical protein